MDRSNKATLPLTIPRSLFKSSAKDLRFELKFILNLDYMTILFSQNFQLAGSLDSRVGILA